MIPDGPNHLTTCPSLPLLDPGGRLGAPPQSTGLGFPAGAPFLSCTHEDFFIVISGRNSWV